MIVVLLPVGRRNGDLLPYLNNTYTLSVRHTDGWRDLLDSHGQLLIFTTRQAALDHAFSLCHCVLG